MLGVNDQPIIKHSIINSGNVPALNKDKMARVLIVDDEPFNLQGLKIIIQQSLKKLGLEKDFLNG